MRRSIRVLLSEGPIELLRRGLTYTRGGQPTAAIDEVTADEVTNTSPLAEELVTENEPAPRESVPEDKDLPYWAKLDEAGRLGRVLKRDDIYLSGYQTGPPVDVVHEELLEFIASVSGPRVLDIGCGIGPYLNRLNVGGFDCVGAEFDAGVVRAATELGRPVHIMDARALAFHEASFDTCLLIEVIEHIDEFEAVLREAARIARRNIVISVPNISAMPYLFRYNVVPWHMLENGHVNFFTPEILEQVLARVFKGARQITVEEYAPCFPWAGGRQHHYQIRAVVELPVHSSGDGAGSARRESGALVDSRGR